MRRTVAGVLLVLLEVAQLLGVPGYHSTESAIAASVLAVFLLVLGYVVLPGTRIDVV